MPYAPLFFNLSAQVCGLIHLCFYQVQHMRRNLDQSEAAIIQVFEEKQRVWERQMDELRQNYASRLQQVTLLHILIQQNNVKVSPHFFSTHIFQFSLCTRTGFGQNVIQFCEGVHTNHMIVREMLERFDSIFTNKLKI